MARNLIDLTGRKINNLTVLGLAPSQKVREGVVVKSLDNYSDERGSKKALKVISEAYLDADNTDFH